MSETRTCHTPGALCFGPPERTVVLPLGGLLKNVRRPPLGGGWEHVGLKVSLVGDVPRGEVPGHHEGGAVGGGGLPDAQLGAALPHHRCEMTWGVRRMRRRGEFLFLPRPDESAICSHAHTHPSCVCKGRVEEETGGGGGGGVKE